MNSGTIAGGIGMVLLVIVCVVIALGLGFGWLALLGWILSAVLGAFGVNVGFWPCFGIAFLVSAFFGIIGEAMRSG